MVEKRKKPIYETQETCSCDECHNIFYRMNGDKLDKDIDINSEKRILEVSLHPYEDGEISSFPNGFIKLHFCSINCFISCINKHPSIIDRCIGASEIKIIPIYDLDTDKHMLTFEPVKYYLTEREKEMLMK